jgi:hypothetical protein
VPALFDLTPVFQCIEDGFGQSPPAQDGFLKSIRSAGFLFFLSGVMKPLPLRSLGVSYPELRLFLGFSRLWIGTKERPRMPSHFSIPYEYARVWELYKVYQARLKLRAVSISNS